MFEMFQTRVSDNTICRNRMEAAPRVGIELLATTNLYNRTFVSWAIDAIIQIVLPVVIVQLRYRL